MRALVASLVLGLAVGLGARAGHALPGDAYWLASLGGPWLAAAFAAGAVATRRRLAALAGAVTIVAGTLTYYSAGALHHAITELSVPLQGARYGVAMALAWSAAGLAIGSAFGLAGFLWRHGGSSLWGAAGIAALAGALVGEALLLRAAWDYSPWAQRVLAIELAAGVVVALALARGHRAAAVALTLASAGVFVVAEDAVRDTLRAAGWAGA